jgi:hypothetical protein
MLLWRIDRSVPAVERQSPVDFHGLGILHGVGDVPS